MEFWLWLAGTVTAELTSADLYGALHAIQRTQIDIWDMEMTSDLSIRFQLRRRDWKALEKLANSRGEVLRILGRKGLDWRLRQLRKRPVLVLGLMSILLFTLWVPGRIFFVQVEGNAHVPTRLIVETAAKCGISFGASRREVRSEKMKNALLEAMPTLSWAGVNTNGCTAVITVRERDAEQIPQQENTVSSIVAARDGIIREITVLRGTGACSVGQAVKAGQVLISGYTDCGLCLQATNAQGEIFAETKRFLTALFPGNRTARGKTVSTAEKYTLIIGKKRINFSNSSGISGSTCAKIYEEKYITLPGGFVLPIGIGVETWITYELQPTDPMVNDQALSAYCRQYLIRQMCAGSILLAEEATSSQEDLLTLRGSYRCYEMIGTTKTEENIWDYVEND